jgi:hypothetical protein
MASSGGRPGSHVDAEDVNDEGEIVADDVR